MRGFLPRKKVMNKHEMRKEAVERLRDVAKHQPLGPLCADDITQALVGDEWVCSTVEEDAKTIIDLLTDDESYEGDAYAMGPRDADGILWFRGDMSDTEWGIIEKPHFDGEKWLVRGHDLTAPWVPADSIRHAPARTATQRESDLIELLKDAAKDYQHEREEVEWQKEMYRSMSDHVISNTMLLPRDADDEVIHIGDEVIVNGCGRRLTVAGVGRSGPHEVIFCVNESGYDVWVAKSCHRYHKPTVDEILDELEGMRGTGDYDDVVERCADLAGMLRELLKDGEDEDQA